MYGLALRSTLRPSPRGFFVKKSKAPSLRQEMDSSRDSRRSRRRLWAVRSDPSPADPMRSPAPRSKLRHEFAPAGRPGTCAVRSLCTGRQPSLRHSWTSRPSVVCCCRSVHRCRYVHRRHLRLSHDCRLLGYHIPSSSRRRSDPLPHRWRPDPLYCGCPNLRRRLLGLLRLPFACRRCSWVLCGFASKVRVKHLPISL
jgi:hypothetical protein